jgi:aminoglycoside phosphotransferase (APT) family kinase protein
MHWIDGKTPELPSVGSDSPTDDGLALDLADFIRALGDLQVPADALKDPVLSHYRSDSLAAIDASTRDYLADCRQLHGLDLDFDGCQRVWEAPMALPDSAETVAARWILGDLLAENLLVRNGRLAAVLDFGCLSAGDPTVDLIVAWEVLDPPPNRELFQSLLGVDEVTWMRGRAWALAIALITFPYYWQTMPERCAAPLTMVRAVLADAAPLLQNGR